MVLTMLNSSISDLPPLPTYTLVPRQSVLSIIPDNILILLVPVVSYWIVSLFFHWIDVNDYFSQYRLHTPAEVLSRNHVSRWDVVRDVIIQQFIQTAFGFSITYFDDTEYVGREAYDVSVWATRIRIAQRIVPQLLSVFGLDPVGLNEKLAAYPTLAGVIIGGHYPSLSQNIVSDSGVVSSIASFAKWELVVAHVIYWYLIPTLQFVLATFFVDTWQYFLHRAMHMNKWLYTTFHSRHHRLYVPYAFGALYNHPFEGFLLDTAGTGLAFLLTHMTTRQGMCFFTGSTIKTIDDHCGYAFPFDPLQHITSNNAAYHDIHHQSWGIKTNFSQPFFTFWDRLLNTRWEGGDVSARYERSRLAAQRKMDANNADSDDSPSVHQQESATDIASSATVTTQEEEDTLSCNLLQRSVRKTTNSFSPQTEGLKGLSHRLQGSIRQK